tara:strand:- start:3752 stop:4705 length:954 start_codon:yes stop_codon:yes gene_type:complete
MLILEDLSAEIPDTNSYHWDLKSLSNSENKDSVLMYGYNCTQNQQFHKISSEYGRKIFFNNWAPCEFSQFKDHNNKNAIDYDEKFNEIYSICPYTSEWLNKKQLGRKYKEIFYPFNKNIIPDTFEKKYDVIYHGGLHGQEHIDCLETMISYNYRYCSMTDYINQRTIAFLPYATNTNLQFQEKINLVAKTKISICYNLVHINPEHIPAIKSYEKWQENEAFSEVEGWNVKPQFKTRMHEAAISRTVNLVMKDNWNVAERYYKPNEDFLYFEDKKDLRNKIDDVLNNWKDYENMIENAYNKAMNYTTEKFVEKIRNDI